MTGSNGRFQPHAYEVDAERVAAAVVDKLRLIRIGRAAIAAADQGTGAAHATGPEAVRSNRFRAEPEHSADTPAAAA